MPEVMDNSPSSQDKRTAPLSSISFPQRNQWEERARNWQQRLHTGLEENNQMIRDASLSDGWSIAAHRSQIVSDVLQDFFVQVLEETSPNGAFAAYKLGSLGRGELCPDSDADLGVFLENIDDNEGFLNDLKVRKQFVFSFIPGLGDGAPLKTNSFHDLRNRNHFDLKMMRSYLDSVLLCGDNDFHTRILRQCEKISLELRFELAFDTIQRLRNFDREYPQNPGTLEGFHLVNGRGGQRNFQLPVWLLGFDSWTPSTAVYEMGRKGELGAPTQEILDAAGTLLLTRAWLATRRTRSAKAAPMTTQDMYALSDRFGGIAIRTLHEARYNILNYREDSIGRLLDTGVVVPETNDRIRYTSNGLRVNQNSERLETNDTFFQLYLNSHRYNLPIEAASLRNIRQFGVQPIHFHPLVVEILAADSPLASTLNDWQRFGVLKQIFPGFAMLSEQFYRPEHRNSALMKDSRALERIANLDALLEITPHAISDSLEFFFDQISTISPRSLAATRLALLTEEIPDKFSELGPSYESRVATYIECLMAETKIDPNLAKLTGFLMLYKRRLLSGSEQSADQEVLDAWQADIESLGYDSKSDVARALALFAFAAFDHHTDFDRPKSRLSSAQWKNLQSLCENLIHRFEGFSGNSFIPEYFDLVGRKIGLALPESLTHGPMLKKVIKRYGDYEWNLTRAHPIINDLVSVLNTGQTKIRLAPHRDGGELILASFNQPGFFWKIASVLHELDLRIQFIELYRLNATQDSAEEIDTQIGNLVVDYITFANPKDPWTPAWQDNLLSQMRERISIPSDQIIDDTAELLHRAGPLMPKLTDLGNGKFKFSFQSPVHHHMLYAVSRNLSEKVAADIYSVSEDGTHDWTTPRMNVYFRSPLPGPKIHEYLISLFEQLDFVASFNAPSSHQSILNLFDTDNS